jgi:hypothetical protein
MPSSLPPDLASRPPEVFRMLSFIGSPQSFCDRLARRDFLRIGALAAGGLTLPDVLRSDAAAATSVGRRDHRPKSIINIYLPGGPSHIDMFDLKPQAPAEIRGEFRPISTNVPGMEICEHFPRLAERADRFAVVRSITGLNEEHRPNQSDSGWSEKSLQDMGGRPGVGAVVSKLQGPAPGCPIASVAMGGFTSPGFLGQSAKDFAPEGSGRNDLRPQRPLPESRLRDRHALLGELDRFRRETDVSGAMQAFDRFTAGAIDVVTTPRFSEALDIDREPAAGRDRYGETRQDTPVGRTNGRFVLARRLIEAGVRVVSFSWHGWDTHDANFTTLKERLPMLDVCLRALLDDLQERGLLDDTMIMMSGEFGRTPRINARAGRDHWAPASFVFVAGGGLRGGQMIGATDRLGAVVQDRPIHLQQVFATVYRQIGIDVETAQFIDPAGRPQYLLDHREPIAELI